MRLDHAHVGNVSAVDNAPVPIAGGDGQQLISAGRRDEPTLRLRHALFTPVDNEMLHCELPLPNVRSLLIRPILYILNLNLRLMQEMWDGSLIALAFGCLVLASLELSGWRVNRGGGTACEAHRWY